MSDAQKPAPVSFAKLRDLTGGSRVDVSATFKRMASLLEKSGIIGKVQFQLLEGHKPHVFSVSLDKKGSKAAGRAVQKPDLEIIVNLETWWEIAQGVTSPLDVFVRGQMRVRGKQALATKIISHLAGSPGRTSIC